MSLSIEAVDRIWVRLMTFKRNPDELREEEIGMLRRDIENRLKWKWTEDEVYRYVRCTEYFDNVRSEERCLEEMNQIHKAVDVRLLQ